MVVSRIVDYDPGRREYALPAEHAMFLTPEAGPNRSAGSIPPDTRRIAGSSARRAPPESTWLPMPTRSRSSQASLDRWPNAFERAEEFRIPQCRTVGLDERLDRGAEVADITCGQGHAANLARAYPRSAFTGFDFSDEGVTAARREAESWGLTNARFGRGPPACAPARSG